MGRSSKAGAAVFALGLCAATPGLAAHGTSARHCAKQSEVVAIAASAVQQQLMVAALTCSMIDSFNHFQTSFATELRASDRTLLNMFRRLYGGHGDAEYHAFKTRLANNSEMRSIHGNQDFCSAAKSVFAAAFAPLKPTLGDFVSGVPVQDASPVDSCELTVATGLQGAKAVPAILPRPKPLQFEEASLTAPAAEIPRTPLSSAPTPSAATPAPSPETAEATAASQSKPAEAPKKKKGWLSGLFN
jgi:hypothetical protein